MARKRATEKQNQPKKEKPFNRIHNTPRERYIYSPERVSVRQVAEEFGVDIHTLEQRCTSEKWRAARARFQERAKEIAEQKYLENVAETRAKQIEEANARHIKGGQEKQALSRAIFSKIVPAIQSEENAGMKVSEGLRVANTLGKTGVDEERKGLGLEQQIVRVNFTRVLVNQFISVMNKYITDPVTYENMKRDLEDYLDQETHELDLVMGSVMGESGE